jgi:hypothetical protein
MLVSGVIPAVASAQPSPDLAVSLSCPAKVKLTGNLKCAMTITNLGDASAKDVTADMAMPSDAQVIAKKIDGTSGGCSPHERAAVCALDEIAAGANATVHVEAAFELPYGARPRTRSAQQHVVALTSVSGDPTPGDDQDQATVKLVYPKTARIPEQSGRHGPSGRQQGRRAQGASTAAGSARATTQFCGVESASGIYWTRGWCVFGISSSRTGGRWGEGWVHATLMSETRYLDPANRDRQLELDVREQVRASTAYGGVSWETVQDLTYHANSFWDTYNFSGNNPYLRWRWRYFGPYSWARATDTFSLQHPGEIYRVQARFQFADRFFHHYFTRADSGWYSIRYVQSGDAGWSL